MQPDNSPLLKIARDEFHFARTRLDQLAEHGLLDRDLAGRAHSVLGEIVAALAREGAKARRSSTGKASMPPEQNKSRCEAPF